MSEVILDNKILCLSMSSGTILMQTDPATITVLVFNSMSDLR